MKYRKLLKKISYAYQQILNHNLVGIYIHGSIAFGCFNWNNSDIDFIVVVERPLSQQIKLELLEVLEKYVSKAPPKGLEMSIVLKSHCNHFVCPTPYELHFSNDSRLNKYLANPSLFSRNAVNFDLAAHFTVIRHVG